MTPRPIPPSPAPNEPLSYATIFDLILTVPTTGPRVPAERWIYELGKSIRRDRDALTTACHEDVLCESFRAAQPVFPTCLSFLFDMSFLLSFLQIPGGKTVNRKALIDQLWQMARELRMEWWENARERAAVVVGVMHACVVEREAGGDAMGELAEMLRGMSVWDGGIDDFAEWMEYNGVYGQ